MIQSDSISLSLQATALKPTSYYSFLMWCINIAFVSSCDISVLYLGTGNGAILLVSLTSFAPYFLKYRGLASGIIASGSGLGGGIFPLLSAFIFQEFHFQHAMLIFGRLLSFIILIVLCNI